MSVKIINVLKNSVSAKKGIKKDDLLLEINGNIINDVLDFMFYIAYENPVLKIQRGDKIRDYKLKKSEYDECGLEFSTFLMDEKHSCKNNCIFCFIDQMPKGMRETLYFKDDDERLSFLHGNYITLTNLSDDDAQRIIKMRLNVNVSVHTTNPELRSKMMNNRFAGEKLKYLKEFAENDIMMNCQIVLCPNFNDGAELERTLKDLADLMPSIQSIAVVPVGLTKFRENLTAIDPFNEKSASDTIDLVEKYQQIFLEKYDTRLVFLADEFYLTAKRDLPSHDEYEDYPQYENGVGITRSLNFEFENAILDVEKYDKSRKVSIASGVLSYENICELVNKTQNKFSNFKCNVYKIENEFFGKSITVSGLVTAKDLIKQLKGKDLGEVLLIPKAMLRADDDVFLDDLTLADVERELSVKVEPVANDGYELLEKMLGE